MISVEMMGLLPPPSYRHRQPPPPSSTEQPQSQQQQQRNGDIKKSEQEDSDHPHRHQQQQHELTEHDFPAKSSGASPSTSLSGSADVNGAIAATAAGGGGDVLSPRQSFDLNYMHRPPAILPNYGKRSRGSVLPKSNVSRVLLYDNITQQTMLDVRMSSIRSQSYKINRELDMHMKSFISRRKVREKALKKITRVQHLDDYVEFIQEQDDPLNSSFLPNIGFQHKTTQHKKTSNSANSLPYLQNNQKRSHANARQRGKSHTTQVDAGAQLTSSNGDIRTLPRITVSSQSLDKTPSGILKAPSSHFLGDKDDDDDDDDDDNDKNLEEDVDDLNNDQTRKVGVHFVEGDKGVTRLFSVVSEVEIHTPTTAPLDNTDKGTHIINNNNNNNQVVVNSPPPHQLDTKVKTDENNNSTQTNNNEPSTTVAASTLDVKEPAQEPQSRLKPRGSIFQLQRKKQEEEELQKRLENEMKQKNKTDLSDIPTELHPEKPIIDSRYLHLRRLLVPQEPPNEGFAELSPSFPKKYPSLKDLSPRTRRKNYAKKQRRKRVGDNLDEEDIYSDDDSEYVTDSSDDEEGKDRQP